MQAVSVNHGPTDIAKIDPIVAPVGTYLVALCKIHHERVLISAVSDIRITEVGRHIRSFHDGMVHIGGEGLALVLGVSDELFLPAINVTGEVGHQILPVELREETKAVRQNGTGRHILPGSSELGDGDTHILIMYKILGRYLIPLSPITLMLVLGILQVDQVV